LLVADWNLPSDLESIVGGHHLARRVDGAWSMDELIKISCKLADTTGFAAFPGCGQTPFGELCEQLPPRERRAFPADLQALVIDLASRINAVESL
jgi:hypothetical protein